jgi:hypothetical protein
MKVSGHLHAPPVYPRGKSPRFPLDRRRVASVTNRTPITRPSSPYITCRYADLATPTLEQNLNIYKSLALCTDSVNRNYFVLCCIRNEGIIVMDHFEFLVDTQKAPAGVRLTVPAATERP